MNLPDNKTLIDAAKLNGDRPAFPSPANGHWSPEYGLTLRQHYAGLAMQGLLAADAEGGWSAETAARAAVAHADALLLELAK